MPRLISEIKDLKLRKLAELRSKELYNTGGNGIILSSLTHFRKTTFEGSAFWIDVSCDLITELPKDHPLYNEL